MTLDEAIKHAEEVAEEQDRLCKRYDNASRCYRNHDGDIVIDTVSVNAKRCLERFECAKEHRQLAEWLKELKQLREQTRWIPFTKRPMTDEESTFYRDWAEYGAEIFDCPLPDDGQEVLVSWGGNVCIDTFVKDDRDGCYFEGIDIDDADAWMPLPVPYNAESEE